MNRGWARTLAMASLLPLAASLGCDALTARSFAGTTMELTFDGISAQTVPAGKHLEFWARTQYDDIVRIEPYYNFTAGKTAPGLIIRQAISADDPCMLDGYSNHNDGGDLLTTPAAFPPTANIGGVMQTDAEQAQQVLDCITQLEAGEAGPLLAVLPFDPTPVPTIPASATPTERRAACDAYKDTGTPGFPNTADLTYIPNPYQVTSPLHGDVYGFVDFTSVVPPANYDGFRIDTPINLKGVQEIFFTVEGDTVDPLNRGPLFLASKLTPGGRDVVHFDLAPPDPATQSWSGTAALYVDSDQDPVQF